MRTLVLFGVLLTPLGCSSKRKENDMKGHGQQGHQHGHRHGDHAHKHSPQATAKLVVATDPAELVAGRPVSLRLMIHSGEGTMVKDFDVMHEEKVHLLIVRDGLDHFAHVHPSVDSQGNLAIAHTFPAGGTYRLFADFTPAGGKHATAEGSISVDGKSSPAPRLVPNAPGEVEGDGLRATITAAPLKAGSPARVSFTLRDERGAAARLELYMGELGHLMFVGADTGLYVHVHPGDGDGASGSVTFEANLAKSGLYKGWGQFKRSGKVRVVPFVLKVE